MQASPSTERTGSAAVRNGLLFGAISAVVYLISAAIQDLTGTTVALVTVGSAFTPLSLLNQVSLLVALVLFFVAGLQTARVTAKLSSPAAAGLIAGLMVSIVEIATEVVNVDFLYRTTIATLQQNQRLVAGGWQSAFLSVELSSWWTLTIYIVLGAGFGFAAGLLQGQIRQEALWR
jgi:hypothetical protein